MNKCKQSLNFSEYYHEIDNEDYKKLSPSDKK